MRAKAIAIALTLLTATSGSAQTYREAPPSISGEIGRRDRVDAEGRRYDDHVIELGRRQRILVDIGVPEGSRLQPGLQLFAVDGTVSLASGAAGEGGGQSLAFTAPARAVYRLRVLGLGRDGGAYAVRITAAPAMPIIGAIMGGVGIARESGGTLNGPLERFIICPGHPRCPR